MRVLHLVSSLRVGGMEHLVLRIAGAQRKRGHDASILALQPGPLADEASRLEIPVAVASGESGATRALRAALFLSRLRPQIAHAHNPTTFHYALLARRLGRARMVVTLHGRPRNEARVATLREWEAADAVVAVSKATAAQWTEPAIQSRLTVIHNGSEMNDPVRGRAEVRASLHLGENPAAIIVARIDGKKGHDTLIHALSIVRNQGIDLVLLVVGDGLERKRIQELALQSRLGEEAIRFLGFRTDVADLLAAADLFVLPSVTEGLPLSVLEAMAQRLPVIATPVGGVPELVQEGETGLLTPVDDPQALALSLARLACDRGLRAGMGEGGRRRVERQFAFNGMLDRYDELYASVLFSGSASR